MLIVDRLIVAACRRINLGNCKWQVWVMYADASISAIASGRCG